MRVCPENQSTTVFIVLSYQRVSRDQYLILNLDKIKSVLIIRIYIHSMTIVNEVIKVCSSASRDGISTLFYHQY